MANLSRPSCQPSFVAFIAAATIEKVVRLAVVDEDTWLVVE